MLRAHLTPHWGASGLDEPHCPVANRTPALLGFGLVSSQGPLPFQGPMWFSDSLHFWCDCPHPCLVPSSESKSSREPGVLCSETSSPAAAERRLSPGQQMQTLLGPLGKPERSEGRFPSQEGWIYVPWVVLEQGLPDFTSTGSLQPHPPLLGDHLDGT